MRITLEDVEDLARGAAILGTGGGGDPYLGGLMLRQVLLDGLQRSSSSTWKRSATTISSRRSA